MIVTVSFLNAGFLKIIFMGSGKFSVLCTHVPLNGNMYLFECFFLFKIKCVFVVWAYLECLCPMPGHVSYVLYVGIFVYVLNMVMLVYALICGHICFMSYM